MTEEERNARMKENLSELVKAEAPAIIESISQIIGAAYAKGYNQALADMLQK